MQEIINTLKAMQTELQELRDWKASQERINECEKAVEAESIAEFNAFIAERKAKDQSKREAAQIIKTMLK